MTERPEDTAYDAYHLNIWRKAGLASVVLKPLGYKQAYALRAQLYRLRKRLIKDRHEVALVATEGTIKLFPEKDAEGKEYFVLMIHPRTMGYEAAYLSAGIKGPADEEEPPPLD